MSKMLAEVRPVQPGRMDSLMSVALPDLLEPANQPMPILMGEGSNAVRWQPGERLHHLFEQRCLQFLQAGDLRHLAVDSAQGRWTYPQLDLRANQLARYLLVQGYQSGDVIGLLFDKSANSYLAMLAVLKINAAYVPLDPGFPDDRIAYIAEDAGLKTILTLSGYQPLTSAAGLPVICLDQVMAAVMAQPCPPLRAGEVGEPSSELCYIIYTSGSTGRPKGVPIEQASICNFVRVAAEVYGYTASDRVYQGLTIAFDFAVEEIWVPLVVGATLLPNQTGSSLLGADLAEFLLAHQATALCCVPTLLATMDQELPDLRLLIVSGEACPQDLIARWYQAGRTILNAYGPTEITVTATLARSRPDGPGSIGKPLPTYSVIILEPGTENLLPFGEEGEIVIGGVGVANGYLNREEQTRKVFIKDFLPLPNNPSGRLYRTGDLGLVNAAGEVEYRGRIDLQVKIRGYRIELTEIESVLLQVPQVAQAVVETFEPTPGVKELVAYYTLKDKADPVTTDVLVQALREKLPAYMVPAYYEPLDSMPMLASNKADRKALPKPHSVRMNLGSAQMVEPQTQMETQIARVLATLLGVGQVSVEDHFFDDLGASSLLMAKFTSALRKQEGIIGIAMRDIYAFPTVASLAAYLEGQCKNTDATKEVGTQCEPVRIPSDFEYYRCGFLQLGFYLTFMLGGLWGAVQVIPWVVDVSSGLDFYMRVSLVTLILFMLWLITPIAVKWTIIGRWHAEKIPIWSLAYFKFWVVKQFIYFSPLMAFKGSPFYNVYLRLLGAKIGHNVIIECEHVPVCTDMLVIGDDSVISDRSMLVTYKARSNYIYTGSIFIGNNVLIGEGSTVDINTIMEDNSQLAHASSLHEGQHAYAGKSYHGVPARETPTDFRLHAAYSVSKFRKMAYFLIQFLTGFLVATPVILLALYNLVYIFGLPTHEALTLLWWVDILIDASVFFVVAFGLGLLFIGLVPRLVNALLSTGHVYIRYGFHFFIAGWIKSVTNSKSLNLIFGDSSYITAYLKWIGYKFQHIIQTGSNFGVAHEHVNPFMCHIGTRTMVSDGLVMVNTKQSSTAFELSHIHIGADNFLGNHLFFIPNAMVGNNCLIATKAMIPIDGVLRENTGILGSPSFEIPRATGKDKDFDPFARNDFICKGIKRKNGYNLRTILLFLMAGFLPFLLFVTAIYALVAYHPVWGFWGWLLASIIGFLFSVAYLVALEWWALGFCRMKPVESSIYDPIYWKTERYWKFSETFLNSFMVGTPFRAIINKMMGVRQGKKVFDDGLHISEKTLVEIGDYCNFNASSVLQSHSLEQGRFKCDYIKVGDYCSVESNAFIHYGATIGDHAVIGMDSFVMKGEVVESGSVWRGNPAQAV